MTYHSHTLLIHTHDVHYVWQSTSVCKSRRVSDVSRHGRVSALSATYAPPPPTFSVSYSTYVRSFVHSYCGLADERTTWFLSRCPLSLSLVKLSLCNLVTVRRLQTRTPVDSVVSSKPTLSSILSMDISSFQNEYIRELFSTVFLANDENRMYYSRLFVDCPTFILTSTSISEKLLLNERVRTELKEKLSRVALENIFL